MTRRIAVKITKAAVTKGHPLWPHAIPVKVRGRALRRLYKGASPEEIIQGVAERGAKRTATTLDNIARNYFVARNPAVKAAYEQARARARAAT